MCFSLLFLDFHSISTHTLAPFLEAFSSYPKTSPGCHREEPMTEVTGFRQSVRLFQSCDPVTPSILSSFLLHLSDALPSGRVLLRLSVRVLTLTVLLRCRLFKWAFTTASTLPRGTVASLSGYFLFRSACLYVTGFTRCWINSYF